MRQEEGRVSGSFTESTVKSRTLAALRDALLPKLISGKLRVKDAEKRYGRPAGRPYGRPNTTADPFG